MRGGEAFSAISPPKYTMPFLMVAVTSWNEPVREQYLLMTTF